MIVAVNKMDLVEFSEERFDDIVRQVLELGSKVGLHEIEFIPISALNGDNVVDRSSNMPWYAGPPLLERLETIPVEPPAVMARGCRSRSSCAAKAGPAGPPAALPRAR